MDEHTRIFMHMRLLETRPRRTFVSIHMDCRAVMPPKIKGVNGFHWMGSS
jgi:hypothetical protein